MLPRDPRRGALFDLSNRTKLRFTGLDRIRFVNGQITNDIRKATESSALAACVLNAKGKLNAHVFVSLGDDSILMDADVRLRDSLAARLERYIIADDVQLEDVTAQFSILHIVGEIEKAPAKTISANRFGMPGVDLWVDASQHAEFMSTLSEIPFCDDACAEVFRIEQGIPIWGRELTEETIPIEANLEESCIDYQKGCYIGQEVISRMKMSGQRNKGLYGLVVDGKTTLADGAKLFASGIDGKEAGWITSAAFSDRLGKSVALGYVKRPFHQPGAELVVQAGGDEPISVGITDLPFESPVP